MACNDVCCPPHNFAAVVDPTVNDCDESVVPGYVGGYCPGSYWYNNETGVLWIGANDMACGSANWINLNPPPMYHLRVDLVDIQDFSSIIVPEHPDWTTENVVHYTSITRETESHWDSVTHRLVAPNNGYYLVNAGVRLEWDTMTSPVFGSQNGVDFVNTEVNLTAVTTSTFLRFASWHESQAYAEQLPEIYGSVTVYLNGGDTLSIVLSHTADKYLQTKDPDDGSGRGFLTIDQLV